MVFNRDFTKLIYIELSMEKEIDLIIEIIKKFKNNQDYYNRVGIDIEKIQLTIMKNENKYDELTSDDILNDIFNND